MFCEKNQLVFEKNANKWWIFPDWVLDVWKYIMVGIENSFSGLNIGCEKIGLAFWNNVI